MMFFRTAKAACVAALLTSVPAWAGEAPWRISQMSGPVRIERAGVQQVAVANRDLKDGDTIVTGKGARAVLVRGRQYMTIAPDSRMAVFAPPQPGGFTRVIQTIGSALFSVDRKADKHFRVETPQLAAVVKGTTFTVTTIGTASSVQVTEGAVEVATLDGGARDLVTPGMIGMIDRADPFSLTIMGRERKVIESPNRPAADTAATVAAAPVAAAPASRGEDAISSERSGGDVASETVVSAQPTMTDGGALAMDSTPMLAMTIVSRSAQAATRAMTDRSDASPPRTPAPTDGTAPGNSGNAPGNGSGNAPGNGGNTPGNGSGDAPGNSGNAPGNGSGDAPGNGGNAPGNGSGNAPGDSGSTPGNGSGEPPVDALPDLPDLPIDDGMSAEEQRLALEGQREQLEAERAQIESAEGSGGSRWQQVIDLIRAVQQYLAGLHDDDAPGMGGGDDSPDEVGNHNGGGNGNADDDDDDNSGRGNAKDDDDNSGGGNAKDDDDNSGRGNAKDDDDDKGPGKGKDDDDDKKGGDQLAGGMTVVGDTIMLPDGRELPASLLGTRMLDNLLRQLGLGK